MLTASPGPLPLSPASAGRGAQVSRESSRNPLVREHGCEIRGRDVGPRMDAVLQEKDRTDFVRRAVEREIERLDINPE